MIAPDEVVAKRVLPTLRAAVAVDLSKRGLTEREIAERLGLTQSAVSKYLRGRTKSEPAVVRSPAFRSLADRLAQGLEDGSMSPVEAMAAVNAVVRREENRGVVCTLHEEEVPALRGLGCDLCVRPGASDVLAEQEVLGDLRAALRTLERDTAFARIIPSVGSNLARAKRGATTQLEVAAVPGRIFEMRGAVRVPAAPEFGASRHVAEVVLAACQVFPDHLAGLNVRAERGTLAAASRLGWGTAKFAASYEGRNERIASVLRRSKRPPRAVYHLGAFGIEPVMYIIGRTAGEVVRDATVLAAAVTDSR